MQKTNEDIFKGIVRVDKQNTEILKDLEKLNKNQDNYSKEVKEIKSLLRTIDRKLTSVLEKVQEFEVIMDAIELIEDEENGDLTQTEIDSEQSYDTEWTPEKDLEEDED